jgi:hypothetical protein
MKDKSNLVYWNKGISEVSFGILEVNSYRTGYNELDTYKNRLSYSLLTLPCKHFSQQSYICFVLGHSAFKSAASFTSFVYDFIRNKNSF